ncbi:MAG: hypothetical protein WD379_00985 [Dehalococcoidia bacterium]
MADIEVRIEEADDGWTAVVEVSEDGGQTTHRVAVTRDAYDRLSGGAVTPEELVRRSFEFLLEREPKESILREFDLTVISRYFPEYEEEIRRWPA